MKNNSKQEEISVFDQLKLKISEQNKLIELTKVQLKYCKKEDEKGLKNSLEEQETLLKSLYENLQSLAMLEFQRIEVIKETQESQMISDLSKKINQQLVVVEKCRGDLVACSGSYQETILCRQNLEENLTLLNALQDSLKTLRGKFLLLFLSFSLSFLSPSFLSPLYCFFLPPLYVFALLPPLSPLFLSSLYCFFLPPFNVFALLPPFFPLLFIASSFLLSLSLLFFHMCFPLCTIRYRTVLLPSIAKRFIFYFLFG